MFRRKRRVTPARLAVNRRAALKSTGPGMARGKERSSLNALRTGGRSKTIDLLRKIMAEAPACGVIRMAHEKITNAQRSHPEVCYTLNLCLAEGDVPIEPEPGGMQFLADNLCAGQGKRGFTRKERSKPKSRLESVAIWGLTRQVYDKKQVSQNIPSST